MSLFWRELLALGLALHVTAQLCVGDMTRWLRRKQYNKEKCRVRKSVKQRLRQQHEVVCDELKLALAENDTLLYTVSKLGR